MNTKRNFQTLFALVLVTLLMATSATAAFAAGHGDHDAEMVDLTVEHRILGLDLGLQNAALPVDVCVNDGYAFTFSFWDTVETEIPAGTYTFDVHLESDDKCAGAPVLTLGPTTLVDGSDVMVRAETSRNGVPSLNASVQ